MSAKTEEEISTYFSSREETKNTIYDWDDRELENELYVDMTDYENQKQFIDVTFGVRHRKALIKLTLFVNLFNGHGYVEAKTVWGLKEATFRNRFKDLREISDLYDVMDDVCDRCRTVIR